MLPGTGQCTDVTYFWKVVKKTNTDIYNFVTAYPQSSEQHLSKKKKSHILYNYVYFKSLFNKKI